MNISNKDILDFLTKAKAEGISVFLENGKLRYTIDDGKLLNNDVLAELKKHKADILEFFISNAGVAKDQENKIVPFDRTIIKKVPLTFSQERLWFIDRMDGSKQYHLPAILRLKGKINKEALEYSLKNIVNRHEILRTVILEDGGAGYQLVKEKDFWKLQIIDGSQYTDNPERLRSYIRELLDVPFVLSEDYMLRAQLIKIDTDEHILVLTMHHIASDGWSTSIIVKELAEFYRSFEENREALLPPLRIQYSDFALWQKNHLNGDVLKKKLDYWKNKLSDVEPLQLSSDFPRPTVQSSRGAIKGFSLDKELSDSLQTLSKQHGVTLFMTLLAAFNVLLNKYSGQSDVCVGSPIAGRQQEELEDLIGFFVNTLAMRSEVKNEETFIQLLQQVRKTTLDAYENQEVPFEKIVDSVSKQRDMSRSPLFQVTFVLQNTPDVPELRLGELRLSNEEYTYNISKYDFTFFMFETSNGLQGDVEYCTDLYKEETIVRITNHFKELLKSIVKNPEEKIGKLQMLSKAEEQQLSVGFNDNVSDYPRDKSIAELFEEQAAKTPDAVAIVFENEKLSYKELNERSNKLAHYLQSKGVKKESLVPVCIERSSGLMVGILGVLKAGCAYVPIDPEYPEERIRFMLKDTASSMIVSSKECIEKLPALEEFDKIEIDKNWKIINEQPSENLQIKVKPEDLAYVIYTSGSTGWPKGVMVTQRNVVSLVKGVEYVNFTKEDVLLSTGSTSFDATTFEYWGMLLNGGQLVLCTEDRLLDSGLLKDEIETRGVTKMWFTSSWFNNLIENDITIFAKLKTILAGGEKLSEYHIEKMRQTYPEIEIINGYGPTENTTFSLTYNIKETEIRGTVPIGIPLNNRTAYILNSEQQLVPIGVTGEVYLGGDGLSKGYLNNPELTNEKFIKDIFSKDQNARLYKTGDLGRWLPNGNIEYLGRKDEQVKIRGYRIELGEIEAALNDCETVRQAVVMLKSGKEGNKRLVGFIVSKEKLEKESIVSELKKKLPDYMIPAIWVEMDSLPLTSNGKVDKKALPDPDIEELLTNEYEAPRDELEWSIAKNWKSLLDLKKVGINDNFFELGGHSLLALRVFSYIEKLTGKKLPISTLFTHPTIKELSDILKGDGWKPKWKSLVAVRAGGSKLPLYCIPAAAGTALHFSDLLKYIPSDQPFYVLESIGNDGSEPPHTDLREMAAFYIKEVRSLQPEGPYLLGGRCFGGSVAFEMAQQLRAAGQEVGLLVVFDTWPPMLAPIPVYEAPKRDTGHLIKRTFHHMQRGGFWNVARKYLTNEFMKARYYVKTKYDMVFSNPKEKLFRELWVTHTNTYINYVAEKYSGKISMIDAEDLDIEHSDGWKYLAEGGIESYMIKGATHYTIMKEPYIRQLAERLNYFLEKTNKEIESRPGSNGKAEMQSQTEQQEEVNA
jgi:amino acid adenylation domain-containing protein